MLFPVFFLAVCVAVTDLKIGLYFASKALGVGYAYIQA